MARLLEGGLLRLADSASPSDAAAAAKLLPRVVHLMVPLVRISSWTDRVVGFTISELCRCNNYPAVWWWSCGRQCSGLQVHQAQGCGCEAVALSLIVACKPTHPLRCCCCHCVMRGPHVPARLPFNTCLMQLSAEQDGMRYNASGALQSFLNNCATPSVLAAMQQQQQQQQRGGMSPLNSLVAAVASSLGARYQEAWGLALPGKQEQ